MMTSSELKTGKKFPPFILANEEEEEEEQVWVRTCLNLPEVKFLLLYWLQRGREGKGR